MKTKKNPMFLLKSASFLAGCLFFCAGSALAGDRYVSQLDFRCGGNSPCHTSIQTAVNAAADGDEIKIAAGVFNETVELDDAKSITLSGSWNDSFTDQTGGRTIMKNPSAPQGCLTMQALRIHP